MIVKGIPTTLEQYRKKQEDYEELAARVNSILFELFNIEKINYALTDFRKKSLDSFQSKIKDKVKDEDKKLYDLTGIRVVCYVKSDVEKIVEVIKKNFDVDNEKSKDKSSELKPNQSGYRAIHLICKLPRTRIILPEYKKFTDMYFEIQVKTILAHAWAQIEHDRNYKYKTLPDDIQRAFFLISSSLELTDQQFDELTKRIDQFDKEIKEKTKQGKLDEIKINPSTLKHYLLEKFQNHLVIEHSFGDKETGESEVKELADMGVTTLSQLDKIIPKDYLEKEKKILKRQDVLRDVDNLTSLVFSILLMVFGEKCWDVLSKSRTIPRENFDWYVKIYADPTIEEDKRKFIP